MQLAKRFWREISIAILLGIVGWLVSLKNTIKTVETVSYRDKIVKVVEERIVYKDRVQVKTRTIHKKGDEVHVKEVTRTGESSVDSSISRKQEQETRRTEQKSVVTEQETSRFVLGVHRDFYTGRIGASVQYRVLPSLPIAIGPQVTVVNRVWTLGIGVSIAL